MIVRLDYDDLQRIRKIAEERFRQRPRAGRLREDAYLLAVYGEVAFCKGFADYRPQLIADNPNLDGDVLISSPTLGIRLVYDVVTVDAADERGDARRDLVVPGNIVESRGKESRVIYVLARKLTETDVELVGYCYGSELQPDKRLQRFNGYSRAWRGLQSLEGYSAKDHR